MIARSRIDIKVFRNRSPSCSLGRLDRMERKERKGGRNKWHLDLSIHLNKSTVGNPLAVAHPPTLPPDSFIPLHSPFAESVSLLSSNIFSSVSSLNAFRWRSLLYYLYNTIFPLLSLSTRVAREHFSNADSYSLRRFFRLAVRFFEDGTGEERRRARSSIIECHIRWSIGRWMNVAVEESRG